MKMTKELLMWIAVILILLATGCGGTATQTGPTFKPIHPDLVKYFSDAPDNLDFTEVGTIEIDFLGGGGTLCLPVGTKCLRMRMLAAKMGANGIIIPKREIEFRQVPHQKTVIDGEGNQTFVSENIIMPYCVLIGTAIKF